MNKKNKSMRFLSWFTVFCVCFLCAFQTFRSETGEEGANVISVKTPIHTEKGGTRWTRSFSDGDGKTAMNSDPVITENRIYIVNRDQLYELGLDGKILRQLALGTAMDSTCHLLLEENSLYIPLSGGKIQCVDIETFTFRWESEEKTGQAQSLSTLFLHDGFLYAGSTVVDYSGTTNTTGVFYCLDAQSGALVWSYEDTEHPGGYYWSGGIVRGNALLFSGDNGILVSHSLTTEEVYGTYTLTDTAKIRSGLTYDRENDALYTVSNDGTVFKIKVGEDGQIQDVCSEKISGEFQYINCTSTPTIYNNRLYLGFFADQYGRLAVIDAKNLQEIYLVTGEKFAEIKSSPLVSTAYATKENHQKVYVYVSCNALPGGVYFIQDDETKIEGSLETLYEPAVAKQYCMSSITAGEDGTLYYSNDSGTLFAVAEVEVSSDAIDQVSTASPQPAATDASLVPATPVPVVSGSSSASAMPAQTAGDSSAVSAEKKTKKNYETPDPPTKIKIKKKKKKIVITWKKKKKKYQTVLEYKTGKGKWKKKVMVSKTTCTIKRSNKKIIYRLRTRIYINKKWIYSRNTRIKNM